MRPVRALLIYILVVFVGGALLAPWLYWLVQSQAHLFPKLAANPFHRFVHRSLLGVALIGLWPLMRSLGATSWRDIGWVCPKGQWKKLSSGFLLGFASLAVIAVSALLFGAREINQNLASAVIAKKVSGAMATAVVVAVLEETLFRGAIFGSLKKVFHWVLALLLSSAIYAIVHFLANASWTSPVTWLSGLELLPKMLSGFVDWQQVIPGFFNLTLVGAILALAYQRTGNLYFSMGLHAGWIFWLRSVRGGYYRKGGGKRMVLGHRKNDKWLAGIDCPHRDVNHLYTLVCATEKKRTAYVTAALNLPVKSWLDAALAFVYPEVCQMCGENPATPAEGFVCAQCWQGVRFVRPPFCQRCGLPYEGELTAPFECTNCREMELHFRSARSATVAQGVVLEVIHRYKYQRALWFEPFLVDLLIREAAPELRQEKWDWLVPVPLYSTKQREREFNQAERLAGRLSAAVGIPLNTRLLKRVLSTRTQTLLTRHGTLGQHAERVRNTRKCATERQTDCAGGRRVHHRRDHKRLRKNFVGRRSQGSLCLDSCPRALNPI